MARPVKGKPKTPRSYVSAKRDEQARATRRAILEAARVRFLESGYGGTTIQAIADEAGVAVQTIYAVFGNKREILKQLIDDSIGGDDEPLSVHEREPAHAVEAEPDIRKRARLAAAMTRGILERSASVTKIARDAASADAEVAELYRMMSAGRREGMSRGAARLAGTDGLRVPVEDAADTLYALISPDVALLLTGDLGWSFDRYEAWLADMIERALLP